MFRHRVLWGQLRRCGSQNVAKSYSSGVTMENKVALITGGAQGLGRAFAEALLDKGAKVCISDVNVATGKQTEAELQDKYRAGDVFFHKCDVTSEAEIEDTLKGTVQRFGHLDILCNNAGILNENNWRLMLDINLVAVIQVTTSALKYMGKAAGRTDGVIINVSSAAGVLPMPFGPGYTAVKHGVLGYSRSLGIMSRKMYGVRVNNLCPSFTHTDIIKPKPESFTTEVSTEFADMMMAQVGIMHPPQVAESFMELVTNEKLSGASLLVTPKGTGVLSMPNTVEEAFEVYSKL